MLHAPKRAILVDSPIWDKIVANRHMAYSKSIGNTLEYCAGQSSKYSVKGERLKSATDALEFFKDFNEQLTLNELPEAEFPKSEHSKIEVIGADKFYAVCNRKIQFTVRIKQAKETLTAIIKAYGHRANAAAGTSGHADWKALSHAFRAAYQARCILMDGGFEYPLPGTQFIMDVKHGKYSIETLQPMLDDLIKDITELSSKSDLPDRIDCEFWDSFLVSLVRDSIR
jgi:hypothetical protein